MGFFNSLLHALAALALGLVMLLMVAIGGSSSTVTTGNPAPTPSSQAVTASSPAIPPATQAATTSVKNISSIPVQKKTLVPPPHTATSAQTVSSAPAPSAVTDELIAQTNTQIRPSLVNILCIFRTANTASYISGSGLIIDPRGVVLTNAHVAQFFLLQNYPTSGATSCIIRAGNPAAPSYTASLIYLPPLWIANNASQILSAQATGTGERDYAFLYITGPAQSAPPPPASFPALSPSLTSPVQNDPVLLAGYPAGALDAGEVQGTLYISSVVSTIQDLYTFKSPTEVDLISLGGTVLSQSGSSGGAVINLNTGKLVGLIATESEGTTTASRDLSAITLGYIDKNLQADGKVGIASLLAGDLLKTEQDFNTNIAPALTKQLVAAIEKQQ